MKLIAHRGNTHGPSMWENDPMYILLARQQGYDVEIDVWYVDGEFMLGHDAPTHSVTPEFFKEGMWCHAKNYEALVELQKLGVHHFWHEEDRFTITSRGLFWTFPGYPVGDNSIVVMPETVGNVVNVPRNVYGVCSDYVSQLK